MSATSPSELAAISDSDATEPRDPLSQSIVCAFDGMDQSKFSRPRPAGDSDVVIVGSDDEADEGAATSSSSNACNVHLQLSHGHGKIDFMGVYDTSVVRVASMLGFRALGFDLKDGSDLEM